MAATARSSPHPTGLQEAFPSLPTALSRAGGGGGGGAQQERHEFSLVGKTIARPDQLRRGGRDAGGAASGSSRGAGVGVVGSEQEVGEYSCRVRCLYGVEKVVLSKLKKESAPESRTHSLQCVSFPDICLISAVPSFLRSYLLSARVWTAAHLHFSGIP